MDIMINRAEENFTTPSNQSFALAVWAIDLEHDCNYRVYVHTDYCQVARLAAGSEEWKTVTGHTAQDIAREVIGCYSIAKIQQRWN